MQARALLRATKRGAEPCRAPAQARPAPLLRCAAFPALPPLLLASSTRPCADMAGALNPACQQTGAPHCAVRTTRTSSRPTGLTAQRPSQQGNMRYARCLGLPGPLHDPNWPPHTSLAFPSTAGTACPAAAGGAISGPAPTRLHCRRAAHARTASRCRDRPSRQPTQQQAWRLHARQPSNHPVEAVSRAR